MTCLCEKRCVCLPVQLSILIFRQPALPVDEKYPKTSMGEDRSSSRMIMIAESKSKSSSAAVQGRDW